MTNNNYMVEYGSGVAWVANANTMLGAKREATKHACYGFGSVVVRGPEGEAEVKYEGDRRWHEWPRRIF